MAYQIDTKVILDGRVVPAVDGLLVATAMLHQLTLATRNVADTANRGIEVFDPWTGRLHT